MRILTLIVAYALLVGCSGESTDSSSGKPSIDVIVVTGDAAPDSNGEVFSHARNAGFSHIDLNDDGDVAFFAASAPKSDDSAATAGVWTYEDGTLTNIFKHGGTINGPRPGTYDLATKSALRLTNQHRIAAVVGTTSGHNDRSIVTGDPNDIIVIASDNASATRDDPNMYRGLSFRALDDAGGAWFVGNAYDGDDALWRFHNATATNVMTLDRQLIINAVTPRPSTNADEAAILTSKRDARPADFTLARYRAGSMTDIAAVGDTAPGTGGETFKHFSPPHMDAEGNIAFLAYLVDANHFAAHSRERKDAGVWCEADGALQLVVRSDDALPGRDDSTIVVPRLEHMNADGSMIIQASALTAASGEHTVDAVVAGKHDDLRTVLVAGDPAPLIDGATVKAIRRVIGIMTGGNAIVHVEVDGESVQRGKRFVLYRQAPDGSFSIIARSGTAFDMPDGSAPTVRGVLDGDSMTDINANGQLAFTLMFEDERRAIAVVTVR
ncbi:MAG: choice-of-anchor tandem repeat NxxGxxAF-containing protein [Planctomycetota bacterium]